jgi:hypothetical protein
MWPLTRSQTTRDQRRSVYKIHVNGLSPYPVNLCPLARVVEFTGFEEDLGQAIGKSAGVKAAANRRCQVSI